MGSADAFDDNPVPGTNKPSDLAAAFDDIPVPGTNKPSGPAAAFDNNPVPGSGAPVRGGMAKSDAIKAMQTSMLNLFNLLHGTHDEFNIFLANRYLLQHVSLDDVRNARTNSQPDRSWGPNTENALQVVKALAFSLQKIQQDMHLGGNGYDADQLANSIPEDYKNIGGNVDEIAAKLKVGIDQLAVYYTTIADIMTKRYLPQMQNDYTVAQHPNTEIDPYVATNYGGATIPGIVGKDGERLTLANIATPKAFAEYLQSKGIEPTQKNIVQQAQFLKSLISGQAKATQ